MKWITQNLNPCKVVLVHFGLEENENHFSLGENINIDQNTPFQLSQMRLSFEIIYYADVDCNLEKVGCYFNVVNLQLLLGEK
jgi:hypothetical protein